MNILLFGSSGLLGHYLLKVLKTKHKVFSPSKHEVDINDKELIVDIMNKHNIDCIVNAAGMTNVYMCEKKPKMAELINAKGPAVLSSISYDYNAKFIHFSTNFVFDGKKNAPYTEDDKPSPLNVYGMSKYRGELNVLNINKNALIIRSAEIFGIGNCSSGHNIPYYIVRQIINNKSVNLYKFKTSPTYALDIANAVNELLNKEISGIIHLSNKGVYDYFEIAQMIFKYMNKKAELKIKEMVFDFKYANYLGLSSNRDIIQLSALEDALKRFLREVL